MRSALILLPWIVLSAEAARVSSTSHGVVTHRRLAVNRRRVRARDERACDEPPDGELGECGSRRAGVALDSRPARCLRSPGRMGPFTRVGDRRDGRPPRVRPSRRHRLPALLDRPRPRPARRRLRIWPRAAGLERAPRRRPRRGRARRAHRSRLRRARSARPGPHPVRVPPVARREEARAGDHGARRPSPAIASPGPRFVAHHTESRRGVA